MNSKILILLLFVLISLPFFTGTEASYAGGTHRVRLIKADMIENETMKGPTNVFVDGDWGEIYVGRGNRLFILNQEGFIISKFPLGKKYSAKRIAVDRKGTIYVLDKNTWTVSKFDQLGKNLGPLEIEGLRVETGSEKTAVRSLTIDGEDNLYLLDMASGSCLITDTEGKVRGVIGEGELKGYTDVDVSLDGSTLAFLNYYEGKIRLYDKKGSLLAEFGQLSGGPGTFSQPVGISLAPDGRVFALDRNRQTVLIFGRDGQFVSEFGTMGRGIGAFYYPNDIFVDDDYNIYVADTANQRLQRIRIELLSEG